MNNATLDPTPPSETQPADVNASPDAAPPVRGERLIPGKRVIAGVSVVLVLTLGLNIVMARRNRDAAELRMTNEKLLNDTGRTKQVWIPVADGMVATFTSVANDPAEVRNIRHDLRLRRTEYLRANYSDAKFGSAQIAGRAVLEFGTANKQLNCRYRDVAGGGELRWITTDSVMLDSLKDWAAKVASDPSAVQPDPAATPAATPAD
jgi:hypothetical protein